MKNSNLSGKIYQEIKDMLVSLVFAPGSTLREQVLADMLGVSRTPVREALQRLSLEGWVQLGGRRRIYVNPVTVKDIRELFHLRQLIEPQAAEEALKRGRSRVLAGKLDEVLNVMARVKGDRIAFARLDMQFHSLIVRNLENGRLDRFWWALQEELSRVAIMNLTENKRPSAVVEEHERMVEAFWEKDRDSILKAIDDHLAVSEESFIQIIGENEKWGRYEDDREAAGLHPPSRETLLTDGLTLAEGTKHGSKTREEESWNEDRVDTA